MNTIDVNGYNERGFALVRNAIPKEAIDQLLGNFLNLATEIAGQRFDDAHSFDIATFLNTHKEIQSKLYDDIRKPPWLVNFSLTPSLTRLVAGLLGENIGLFKKIPFRTDTPEETAQLAVWHQDYYYVRGNIDVVTAWVPMQDTVFLNGCLAVMPGSHKLGPLEHDVTVLRKRHYPSGIFDREVRYVEMAKGDVLFFHSCMLHSSSLNLSRTVRYSVQARYTTLDKPVDPGMGGVVPIKFS